MRFLSRATIVITLLFLSSSIACEKDKSLQVDSYLEQIEKTKYYDQELIPAESQHIYGIWKLFGVSGGFLGGGYEPDFQYLEFKQYGIYGLIRGDSLFEYGFFKKVTIENQSPDEFTIEFVSDYHSDPNPYMHDPFNVYFNRQDTLDMMTAYPDGYCYHFKKIK